MFRDQREFGQRWIMEYLSALAAERDTSLTDIEWDVGEDERYWLVGHIGNVFVREGFSEQDLLDLPSDEELKRQMENRLAGLMPRMHPR